MNTSQAVRFPKTSFVIVVLVLLIAALLAISIPLAWSFLSAHLSPTSIQADSLKMVDAFIAY
jgi:hypothetical protein